MIMTRVFHAKHLALLAKIKLMFGKIPYSVRVVEFQRWGLTYAHIILFTHSLIPFTQIDSFIPTEVPGNYELERKAMVLSHNQHAANHLTWNTFSSKKNDLCTYGYPKSLQQYMTTNEFVRIQYHWSTEDNRLIVSYMFYLTILIDSHVNVDICLTSIPNSTHFIRVNWQSSERNILSIQISFQSTWQSLICNQRWEQTERRSRGLRVLSRRFPG